MNVLLWIFQLGLAFLYLAGGAYKIFHFDQISNQLALSRGEWAVLGVVEMLGAVLLIVPAALKRKPGLTTLAAAVLAVESLALAGAYATHSLALTAKNPMVWAGGMGIVVAFVAYGRFALKPFAARVAA